jgi:hypothetical protein
MSDARDAPEGFNAVWDESRLGRGGRRRPLSRDRTAGDLALETSQEDLPIGTIEVPPLPHAP